MKSLRKRKAPSVQAWGKQLTEDKKRTQRSDVLSFDEDDEDDSDNNEADSQGEDSDHDENDGAISQKDNTSTVSYSAFLSTCAKLNTQTW